MAISCLAFISIMFSICLVLFFRFMNKPYNPPIFGVYQRRNKYFWFKFVFMYFFLRAKQLYAHLKKSIAVELGYSGDGTVHVHQHDVALEQMYNLGDYPAAVDAVYFNGADRKGVALITGVARRAQHFSDAFMYLKVDGEDLLMSPSLPNTRIKQTAVEEGYCRADGINLSNVIPMRTWKVSYSGEMRYRSDPGKSVPVSMDLTWSASWPAFNYDTDMAPRSMAKDLAREHWSREYFTMLQKFHQTHYEQMGFLAGTVLVDGKKHDINIPCVRDHTFGKLREWRNFHRYVQHFIYLENGDCMAIGAVSQPVILSHLTIGYLCRKSDQAVLPVKACDFHLWQHGEHQHLPKDYGFIFTAGGETYEVKIQVYDEHFFYIGKTNEAKIYERWASAEVNGVKGSACLEWQYSNAINSDRVKVE